MTKQNFDIDNLRVASPCRAGWETMSGDERVRHCNLCRLNVYNLSEMTADEVRGLITKAEGRICGRLHKRADGTIITKDCPIGFRAYQKRAARMAGAALAAIIGLFSVSYGQKEDEKPADASKAKIVRTINRKNILSGSIKDFSGAIVAGADVVIFKSDGGGEKLKVKSDDEGVYQTPLPAAGIYTLEIDYPGFKFYRVTGIEINNNEEVSLDITLDSENVTMGAVEVMPSTQVFSPMLLTPSINVRKPEKPH
jgi:hypothetical protein